MHKNGPSIVAIPKDVRNFPIVSPILPDGAKSRVMASAVGTNAARVMAWKTLIG